MRPIKFRAWTNGCWLNNGMLYDYESSVHVENFGFNDENVPIMQYTGLKDKHGKDIYEKDIVEYLDGEYSFRAIIELDYHQWYLKGISPIDNYSINDFAEVGQTDLKIIGNVYEHPHLLEQPNAN